MEKLNQEQCAQDIFAQMEGKAGLGGPALQKLIEAAVAIDGAYMERTVSEGAPYDEEAAYKLLKQGLKQQFNACDEDFLELYIDCMENYLEKNGAIDWQ